MNKIFDSEFTRVLAALGTTSHALLGQGGESWVFALDEQRIARITSPGTSRTQIDNRVALLSELERSKDSVPFAIPEILDIVEIEGITSTIERRLPGRPLNQLLAEVSGETRTELIRAYLEAAAQIGDLAIDRSWYGDLLAEDAVRSSSYRDYLEQRADQSLKAAGPEFKDADPAQLAAALPSPDEKSLVHLDAFPGNMLAEGRAITAVLDFGASMLIGDRRLDPLTAVVYLAPSITPTATGEDRAVAQEWLVDRGLTDHFTAVQKWVAAYWSFARDDIPLYNWCRKVIVTKDAGNGVDLGNTNGYDWQALSLDKPR